jgi:proteasome lid subunit RPN8/RPN11
MLRASYIDAMKQLSARLPEQAGVLIGRIDSPVVTHFVLDKNGRGSPVRFELDGTFLNGELRKFLELQMEAKGFVHSHPANCTRLSAGDLRYLQRIWKNPNNDCERIFMPIVVGRKMHAYVVDRDDPNHPKEAKLQLI